MCTEPNQEIVAAMAPAPTKGPPAVHHGSHPGWENHMHPVAAILMVLAAPVALGHTAEELAAKNVEARGGTDKLHAIQSLRLSGKILVNGGTLELGYVSLLKRPQSVRYEAALQGLTLVQAYDGAQ